MQINILFIIMLLILLVGGKKGYQQGLIQGIIRILSIIVGLVTVVLIIMGVGNYLNHEIAHVIAALILIVLISILFKIVNLPLTSLKLLTQMPVVKWLDKIVGIAVGLFESVVFIWLFLVVIQFIGVQTINEWIINQANGNMLVGLLYKTNYFVELLTSFAKI